MNKEFNKSKIIYIKVLLLVFVSLCFMMRPMVVRAVPVSTSGIPFGDHDGMKLKISGEDGFCIQRGYPFRSMVSDIQMMRTDGDITMSEWIRQNLKNVTSAGLIYFRGWGSWELNGDHTNAYQVSQDHAPSSDLIPEPYDKELDDFEDGYVPGKYNTSGAGEFYPPDITGHEGAKDKYATTLKVISEGEAGFSPAQSKALAILNYYTFNDPDAGSYSHDEKYQVGQAFAWAVEFGFIEATGSGGRTMHVVYKNSTGRYGAGGAPSSYSGSCDGYIKIYIGSYPAMKLYRQVVWKTTNMKEIPSFAYETQSEAHSNPIHLKWDKNENAYVATVADGNGVLDYFDFEVPGVTCTENGDGTITIKSANELSGAIVSNPAKSKILPDDGAFAMPTYYRWDLEGTEEVFYYAMLTPDIVNWSNAANAYRHSHEWDPPCEWYCRYEGVDDNYCNGDNNAGWEDEEDDEGNPTGDGDFTYHEHTYNCYHRAHCPYYRRPTTSSTVFNDYCEGDNTYWSCTKKHYLLLQDIMFAQYIDWQDPIDFTGPDMVVDPVYAYIAVITDPHKFPAETDVEILLIADNDEWNNLTYTDPNGKTISHCDHLRVGEKFHLKYVYSYVGASKGFRIVFSTPSKPYYQYNYLSRMEDPYNQTPLYELRSGLAPDRFSKSSINVPHAVLVQDLTPIKIWGGYTTPETPYTLNGTYTWNSGSDWNDQVFLDALVEDDFDDNYNNKPAGSITSNNGSITDFSVTKPEHNKMIVVWEYDAAPEVFSSALVYASAYIEVDKNDNFTKNYFDEAYNYAKDKMTATQYTNWYYSFEDHNNVGGVGYFSSEYTGPGTPGGHDAPQSDNPIPAHTVYTQNNEYLTYAVRNKVWQSNVDIQASNFVQNTGAGITEHIYQERGRDNHDMNYNLYYTIKVLNPNAAIYADKEKVHDNQTESENGNVETIDTTSDVYEFDVNNLIQWGAYGASQTNASYGRTIVVDHIKTGTTYIQREIPTVLATITNGSVDTMNMRIDPNHDRLIYEDHYTEVDISGSGTGKRVIVPMKDDYYPNVQEHASAI